MRHVWALRRSGTGAYSTQVAAEWLAQFTNYERQGVPAAAGTDTSAGFDLVRACSRAAASRAIEFRLVPPKIQTAMVICWPWYFRAAAPLRWALPPAPLPPLCRGACTAC